MTPIKRQQTRLTPALPLLALVAGLLLAPSARAVVVNQADTNFFVPCVADSVQLDCIGNHFSRTQTDRGIGPQAVSDSFENNLGPGVHTGVITSAQASTGNLKASVFGTLVVPKREPATSGQMSIGLAEAFFSDDWTITGPTDRLRRISLHFSLDGSVGDLATIALPFDQVNGSGGSARGTLSVNVRSDAGSNRLLSPVEIDTDVTTLSRCIGFGGCGEPDSRTQSLALVFDVAGGNHLSIQASLFAQASGAAFADFAHTATLDYVTAPDDIEIDAASGELFRQGDRFIYRANANAPQPPVSAVPEPDTLVLMSLGLACIGLTHKRAGCKARDDGSKPL